MWTEQTVINPAAWSPAVEADLEQHVRTAFRLSDVPENFDGACSQARSLLASASGPQVVTLNGDGTATVVPFDEIPTADEHAAREAELEALRASRADA